jgi:hypothetical protein
LTKAAGTSPDLAGLAREAGEDQARPVRQARQPRTKRRAEYASSHNPRPRTRGRTLPKPTAGARLARRILRAVRDLDRADARLVRCEARLICHLKEKKAYVGLGFSSLAHFGRERLLMAPRTMLERVELHMVCGRSPAVEAALLRGILGSSQVVALAPLFRAPGPHEEPPAEELLSLLRLLGNLSVRELRRRARVAARSRTQSANAGEVAESPSWPAALLSMEEIAPDAPPEPTPLGEPEDLSEDEYRNISFTAPATVRILFHEALECAGKVMGRDAPRYARVETILVEGAANAIVVAEEGKAAESTAARRARAERARGSRGQASGRADGRVPTHAACHAHRRPLRGKVYRPGERRLRGDRELRRHLLREARERARRAAVLARAHLQKIDSVVAVDDPRDPEEITVKLLELRELARPGRALLARLVRALSQGYLLRELGYATAEKFCERELGMCERSAGSFCRRAEVFEDCPELEAAVSSGAIPSGAAMRLWRLAGTNPLLPRDPDSRLARWIRRASELSPERLDREYKLFENIRAFSADLASRCRGPLPDPGVERVLAEELIQLG